MITATTHRGDSPSKKVARWRAWEFMKMRMGEYEFLTTPHLVIPSAVAGDISALHALGVSDENIYAMDIDPHAIAAAKRRFPSVNYKVAPFWEVFHHFPGLGGKLGSAFIDLCGPLRGKTTSQHVLRLAPACRYMGYEFLCGREQGDDRNILLNAKPGAIRERIEYLHQLGKGHANFRCLVALHYKSHTCSQYGERMIAALGKVTKAKPSYPVMEVQYDETALRELAINYPTKYAAQAFNLSEGTIAAWKAHETRGTYRK